MKNQNGAVKVSIIMPSFNVVNYIRECMESVVNQTLKDIEIIVVDANSTDGTFEILKEYEERDSRVHILIDDKASTGYANNKAIDYAKGKYIGIVETDDFVRLDMYEKLYEIAEKTGCEIVKGDYDSFSGNGDERRFVKHHLAPSKAYNRILSPRKDEHIFEYVMFNWAGIYNREFLHKNDIRHQETKGASFQDNGFFFLAFSYAEKVYFINESFYRYRRDNPNSSINNPNKVYCMCDEYDYIEKKLVTTPVIWENVRYRFIRKRYGACSWTLKKVGEKYRKDLILRMQKDFSRLVINEEEISCIQEQHKFQIEMKLLLKNVNEYMYHIFNKQNGYEKNIQRLCKRLSPKRDIIIIGCGERGTVLENVLFQHGINISAFADNNISLEKSWNGIPICAVSNVAHRYKDGYYIISPQKGKKSLKEQLLSEGVKAGNIYFYNEGQFVWD